MRALVFSPVLGGCADRHDLHRVEPVDARIHGGESNRAGRCCRPVHGEGHHERRTTERHAPVDARHQLGDVHDQSAERHGQVLEQRARDGRGRRRALHVDRGHDALDVDAGFETAVRRSRRSSVTPTPTGSSTPERSSRSNPGAWRSTSYEPGRSAGKPIDAARVGLGGLRAADELWAADGQLHAGQHRTGRIGHRAAEARLLSPLCSGVRQPRARRAARRRRLDTRSRSSFLLAALPCALCSGCSAGLKPRPTARPTARPSDDRKFSSTHTSCAGQPPSNDRRLPSGPQPNLVDAMEVQPEQPRGARLDVYCPDAAAPSSSCPRERVRCRASTITSRPSRVHACASMDSSGVERKTSGNPPGSRGRRSEAQYLLASGGVRQPIALGDAAMPNIAHGGSTLWILVVTPSPGRGGRTRGGWSRRSVRGCGDEIVVAEERTA